MIHCGTLGSLLVVLVMNAPNQPQFLGREQEQLLGTWQVESVIHLFQGERQKESETKFGKARFTFHKENRLTVHLPKATGELSYRLNPKSNPKTIDLTEADKASGEEYTFQGIYKFENDRLILCYGSTDVEDRPTDFDVKGKRNVVLLVLKRTEQK
jgi:uncharacterized protein (TIGR03067 family)